MNESFNKRVLGIKPTSVAMFQGVWAAIIGLGVAILFSFSSTANFAESTGSLLAGLAFGLATGFVAIILLPFVYFAVGWVVGLVQGFVINYLLGLAGGVAIVLQDNDASER